MALFARSGGQSSIHRNGTLAVPSSFSRVTARSQGKTRSVPHRRQTGRRRKDLNELIAWLKANPDKASAGIGGSTGNLTTAFFEKQTETKFTFVPYRGVAPAVQDLVAGQIDLLLATPDPLPLVRAGRIKAYAVTRDARLALAPDVPTFAELGLPAMSWSRWYGLFAPKDTPKVIISRLNVATVEALADPVVRSRLADLGFEIFPRDQQTPQSLGALQKADAAKWWPLIKEFGIRAE